MDKNMEKEKVKKTMWPQWVAGIGVNLLLLQLGMMVSWSSPYVASLTSDEGRFHITMHEASWIISLLNLGSLVGAITGSITVNYFGTKTTILITSMLLAFCWLFTILANRAEWLYAARFLGGISLGKMYSSFSLYLGEIADPKIRGALVFLAMSGVPIGNLIMCIMGTYLKMEISSGISLILCVILMVIFIWLPESPHHLVKIKSDEKAQASILWYHRDCDVDSELQSLKKFIEINNSLPFMDVLKEFKFPHNWKALLLVVTLLMYSQMCGLNNVISYMETILRSCRVTVIKPAVVVIIVTACGIVSSLFSMLLIDKCGRRVLMLTSTSSVIVSTVCLGTEFQLLDLGYDPDKLQPLPIFAMILFQVSVFIGILSIPTTILGEVFQPYIKCVASCFASIAAGIFSFISVATYQPLVNLITEKYVFYTYSLLLLTAIPYTLLCMPETKGKTLQKIQEELTKKS
ncbi:hypothetical protein DMN91_004210 [Ooceraea biroi]|uniref:Major facilitator superfamily (MFS) profile domain-containing protein n=2 Tax=Ooceraea biroi TaxID=2015173 RepID=A0A3L8DUN0_OOCBI|nr:facilitated trehalose transporter Tret1 [Ooceraea biroi]RLU24002.1 hypothetical protein DMN91_004210 [Ooceraea biroi]